MKISKILTSATGQEVYPFSEHEAELLERYFEMVIKWNGAIHLTTITDPLDFALRNLLEPAFALRFLEPGISEIWDLGSGAGVPGIPMAVLRPGIAVHLVEANKKRSIFLAEAATALGLSNVRVIRSRFEDLAPPVSGVCVTSRAIEGFPKLLEGIVEFAAGAGQLVLFGNRALADRLEKAGRVETAAFPAGSGRLVIAVFQVEQG